jgi:beta-phosphoglucomutase
MKSVVFDVDGVLVDSMDAHFEAFKKVGDFVGVPFTEDHLQQTFGMHNNQIFPLWLGHDLSEQRITELALKKEAMYREIASQYLQPIDGSADLVRKLHEAKFQLAVGSSGPRANVELAVKTLGLHPFFMTLVTGDDVRHGKPAPDIFLQAAEKIGANPKDCLVIEDAPQGVQAALAAGMKVIAVTTSKPKEALQAAHWIVNSLREITPQKILEIIN